MTWFAQHSPSLHVEGASVYLSRVLYTRESTCNCIADLLEFEKGDVVGSITGTCGLNGNSNSSLAYPSHHSLTVLQAPGRPALLCRECYDAMHHNMFSCSAIFVQYKHFEAKLQSNCSSIQAWRARECLFCMCAEQAWHHRLKQAAITRFHLPRKYCRHAAPVFFFFCFFLSKQCASSRVFF